MSPIPAIVPNKGLIMAEAYLQAVEDFITERISYAEFRRIIDALEVTHAA